MEIKQPLMGWPDLALQGCYLVYQFLWVGYPVHYPYPVFLSATDLPTSSRPSLSQDHVVHFQVRPAPPVDQRRPLGPEIGARMGQHVEEHGHLVVRSPLATLGWKKSTSFIHFKQNATVRPTRVTIYGLFIHRLRERAF